MQIFFAAPFLFAAGLGFTILSLIPPGRRLGIPVPTGIIAACPSFVIAMLAEGLLVNWLAPAGTWERWHGWLFVAAAGAVAGGVLAGLLSWLVAQLLPEPLLRAGVFIAAWCSYFVVFIAAELTTSSYGWKIGRGLMILGLEVPLSGIGAFFIAKRSEDFRPRSIRMAWGDPFRLRARAGRGSLEKLRATLGRVSDVEPDPEDRI